MGYSWAAYGPPKLSSQPRAWLVPSLVPGAISRCCGKKYGGCSWVAKAHGRLSGVGNPGPPHHLAGCWVLAPGHSICLFLFPCVFPTGIASHNSAFPSVKMFGSLPRDCSGRVHASPILLLLQRASCSWGTSTKQPKPYWGSHHKGLKAHNLQYHQQNIPHPILNPGNPREAFWDCFTAWWRNGLSGSFLSGSYFPLFKLDKLCLAC